jgi:hypothetical protein
MTTTEWKDCETRWPCRKCGGDNVKYRIREDDEGHEDICYCCKSCRHTWWVEGSDY